MRLQLCVIVLLASAIAQIACALGATAATCPSGYVVVWKTCYSGVTPYPCYDCKLKSTVVVRPPSSTIGKHP